MATAVRLTKNVPLAKSSPMSQYLASKGSTAWETAIKERKEVVDEDPVPLGWRILEKQPIAEVEPTTSNRSSGGLFSFWSRRHSKGTSVSGESPETSPSLAKSPSTMTAETSSNPPRPSQESVKSVPVTIAEDVKPSTGAAEKASTTPSAHIDLVSSPQPSQSPASYADAPEPLVDDSQSPPPGAPSAVSRFLTRFSRKRTTSGSSSVRSSLALSSDDLDVLSDIVPSANDGFDDDHSSQQNPLSTILKAEPLPPALPPPPLAPPPRPASVSVRSSSPASLSSTGKSSSAAPRTNYSDLDDLFGAFDSAPTTSSTPISTPSAISGLPSAGLGQEKSEQPFGFSSFSQPPLLPSPPSSRVQSPPPATLGNNGAHTASSSVKTSSNRAPHPQLSLSFLPPPPSIASIPPPPSTGSSSSSRSEIPLAQLYPNANSKAPSVTPKIPTMAGPPSRSHTPVMISGPPKSSATPPLLAPPPSFASASAAPTANLFDDDDDFDDFQSSSQPAPPEPAAVHPSSFSLLPPPPGRAGSAPTSSLPSVIPPPLSSSTSFPGLLNTPQPLSSDPLHDDFSGFLSSSSTSLRSRPSEGLSLDTSFSSDRSLFSQHGGNSILDDTRSPSSSALRTPSPPRLPAKGPKPTLAINPPRFDAKPTVQVTDAEKNSRTTQHMRTLSLMERAAARPGQWPAPPSPLPQALAFPVPGPAPRNVDLMGDDESFGFFQSQTLAPAGPAPTATLLPPAHSPTPPPLNPSFMAGTITPVLSANTTQGKKSAGGLSAQDLSFFEGL